MLGLLAHAFHLLLLVLGLVGVAWLLLPQLQGARGARRPTYRPPANAGEHEERVAALRAAVQSGSLTTPTAFPVPAARAERDASTWRALAVISSIAAAGVHLAVFPHHLQESVVVGAFFLLVALAQGAWACLVTLDATDDRVLVAAILGSVGLLALWTFSRTTGLPLGLGREPVGGWDVASGVWELVVVAGCFVGLRRPRNQRARVLGDAGWLAWAFLLVSGTVLVALSLTVSHN